MNFFAASKENKYKSMPKILLFICVYFIFSFGATAIEADDTEANFDILLNHTNYGVADGLSQETVTSIVEDLEGYVWIGTINGLNRFDGNEFKQFYADDEKNSLPSSFIRNLLIDDNGELLVGTDKGLVQFDKKTDSFSSNQISILIGEQAIWSISKQKNEVFIGLNNRVISYKNIESNVFDFKSKKIGEIKNIIKINNSIFLRNYNGDIFRVEGNELSKIFSASNEMSILDGKLIASTNHGLFEINKKQFKISNSNFTTIEVNSETGNNELIGISNNNLFKLRIRNNKFEQIKNWNFGYKKRTAK
ncbi:ligand-binding sensor domain-containing protein [Shewanella frigidimarina]|uniref:ligand-binding sensor domain-containing protein n=1 Tax=Shewanella frigidimarina TaxID=56812 RepID=UPI003D7BF28A